MPTRRTDVVVVTTGVLALSVLVCVPAARAGTAPLTTPGRRSWWR